MTQLSNKYLISFWRVSLSIIFILTTLSSYAQKKEKVYMSMDYKQIINEYRLVEVTIRTRVEGKFQPLQNVPIDVTMKTEDSETLLATINSNEDGFASLVIDKDFSYFRDEEGKYTLYAKFEGNETYKKASKKSKMKDLFLYANLIEENSVKTIHLSALEFVIDSLSIPLEEIDFIVFVDRIFADLKIANGKLINGKATVIFPDDIPGDKNGNINILVNVDEKNYQIVELTTTKSWGTPLVKEKNKNKNAASISYVVFMIVSTIVIAIFGLLLSKRINNKS